MNYPDSLAVKKLEERHPEVAQHWDTLECIDDLYEGGQRIYDKRKKYIHRKPDEDDSVYAFRLGMFTYDPILSENINKMLTRMSAAQYVVEGLSKAGRKGDLWSQFRKNMDNCGMHEPDFIESTFEKLLKYRKVYAVLDFEEGSPVPYITLFDPRHVIHYSESGGKLNWVKIRQIVHDYSPTGEHEIYLAWTIIDDKQVVKYRADLDFDMDENLVFTMSEEEVKIKIDDLEKSKQLDLIAYKESEVEHGWDRIPVVKCELKEGLWVTSLVVHLMKEHIRLHNNIATTGMLAGQIQRLFTPLQEKADETVDIDAAKLQTGNEHVLIGQNFSFNETQGSAIKTVNEYLSKIENRIKDLLFSSGISSGQVQPSQESGVAKSLDFVAQEQALQSYGQSIVRFYREILKLTAIAIEEDQDKIEQINVNGLNEFILDSLDNKVERLQKLAELSNEIPISNTAFRIIVEDLQRSMSPYASPEEIEAIMAETAENWEDDAMPEFSFEELNNMVLDRIIDKNTARTLLDLDPEEIEDKIEEEMRQEAQVQAELQRLANGEGAEDPNMAVTAEILQRYAQEVDVAPMELITYIQEQSGVDLTPLIQYIETSQPATTPEDQMEAELPPAEQAIQALVTMLEDFDFSEEDLAMIAAQTETDEEAVQALIDVAVEVTGLGEEEVMAEMMADMAAS